MKDRLIALALCAVMALSLLPAALAVEKPVPTAETAAVPVAPRAREIAISLEEEPAAVGEEPATLLADGEPDYEGAKRALRQGVLNHQSMVSLYAYRIPVSEVGRLTAYTNYLGKRYASLFDWGDITVNEKGEEILSSGEYSRSGDMIYRFKPLYRDLGEDNASAKEFYNKTLDDIVAQIPEASTTNELKALFIHDYLATHYAYDHRKDENGVNIGNSDVYSFFKEGKGVCEAYMLVFNALMDKLDIPVDYVESDMLNHTWNIIQLEEGGPWYHVDVTWDDPTVYCGEDEEGKKVYADMPNGAKHDYFLISDTRNVALREEWARAQGLVYKNDQTTGAEVLGDAVPTCPDSSFERFYADADSPIVYVPGNDSWYYVSSRCDTHMEGNTPVVDADYRGIYRWDPESGDSEKRAYTSSYKDGICGLVEHEGSLFFSVTDGIHRYELAGDSAVQRLVEVSYPVTIATQVSGLSFAADGTLSYVKQGSQERVTVNGAKPWHALWDENSGIQYYYNFGAVALQVTDGGPDDHIFLAWRDPDTGAMTRLVAAKDGTFGVSGEDKGKNIRAYRLSKDGTLKPLSAPFVIRDVGN